MPTAPKDKLNSSMLSLFTAISLAELVYKNIKIQSEMILHTIQIVVVRKLKKNLKKHKDLTEFCTSFPKLKLLVVSPDPRVDLNL